MNDTTELYQKVHELFADTHDRAHDEKHALRVSVLARKIAEKESYDPHEAEIAGLLHDVGRTIQNPKKPHALLGLPIAKNLLDNYTDFLPDAKDRILAAIERHSDLKTTGKLNNILQDADKLDGMGAIGISRAYANNLPAYDSDDIIPLSSDYGNLKNAHEILALTIEWYGMLYTDSAKVLGKPRYEFMKHFFEKIKTEIEESS